MEPDGITYTLPHPTVVRAILAIAGMFVLFIAPYELWRGVWPLNITTPFFAFIMFGGMSVGAAFLYAGIMAPSGQLRFKHGVLEITYSYLWGQSQQIVRTSDIAGFEVKEEINSEGPNDWYAVINLNSGKRIASRPLGTKEVAETLLSAWQRILMPEHQS